MPHAIGKEEGKSQTTRMLTRNSVHHPCRMCNWVKPKGTRHLLLGEVGGSNVYHHFPVQFNKPVGRLALCRSGNNFRLVIDQIWDRANYGLAIDQIFADRQTKQFEIAVQVKATCQQTSHSTEETECRYNVRWGESLEAKSPIVSCDTVNEDESIAISANRDTVAKHADHVDSIQGMVFSAIEWTASFGFWNCGVRTKGGEKLATVNPFTITTDLK